MDLQLTDLQPAPRGSRGQPRPQTVRGSRQDPWAPSRVSGSGRAGGGTPGYSSAAPPPPSWLRGEEEEREEETEERREKRPTAVTRSTAGRPRPGRFSPAPAPAAWAASPPCCSPEAAAGTPRAQPGDHIHVQTWKSEPLQEQWKGPGSADYKNSCESKRN
ncbi:collagen alpha-1(I) chain-like [Corvus hawaiiensis]|uniref:collagen alpha-1(I) chain-like n=1 Tax=Corvus hawaiiensis TaxID=134902 RepID=UPI00201973D2|nr:collagen alpha-1(I) chain-like [Corvus hawaiiensis]